MPTIHRLTLDDLPELERLFRAYPHKVYQQRFQGIDADKLAAFFARGERMRLEKAEGGEAPPAWVARERDGALTAFASLRDDAWHASFYKRNSGMERMARVAPFLAWRASDRARRDLLETLLDHADSDETNLLSTRVDASECDLAALFTERDFYTVDCSVKMSARMADIPDCAAPTSHGRVAIRHATQADTPAIREIAATSHPYNHFYNDPHLDRRDTDALFVAWVEKCLGGLASDVFVAQADGRVLGFVIYLTPASLNKALGTHLVILDFVCLAHRVQGGGIGRWLIAQTLRKMANRFDTIELRTSANNYPALACYRDLAFRIVSTDYGLHRVRQV